MGINLSDLYSNLDGKVGDTEQHISKIVDGMESSFQYYCLRIK